MAEKAGNRGRLTQVLVPFRLRTRVTSGSPGTAASSTTKRGLRRIRLSAAGKGDLTDAKKLQGNKLTDAAQEKEPACGSDRRDHGRRGRGGSQEGAGRPGREAGGGD